MYVIGDSSCFSCLQSEWIRFRPAAASCSTQEELDGSELENWNATLLVSEASMQAMHMESALEFAILETNSSVSDIVAVVEVAAGPVAGPAAVVAVAA